MIPVETYILIQISCFVSTLCALFVYDRWFLPYPGDDQDGDE